MAGGRGHEPLTALVLQVVLAHQSADLLGIDDHAATTAVRHPPADSHSSRIHRRSRSWPRRLRSCRQAMTACRNGWSETGPSAGIFGGGDGPVMDILVLLGRGALFRAPLETRFSTVCRPACVRAPRSLRRSPGANRRPERRHQTLQPRIFAIRFVLDCARHHAGWIGHAVSHPPGRFQTCNLSTVRGALHPALNFDPT